MRVLVVYAHPLETSYVAGLHGRVLETLRGKGHEIDDLDLYAENFNPVLSAKQMRVYVNTELNARDVEPYVARLRATEALVLVFPVWFDGLPAIMQGYFQRVFLPGVSTVIDEHGLFHPNLPNLKRIAAVSAYGENRKDVAKKHDPPRRFVRDNIGRLMDPNGRFEYLALYGMDSATGPDRDAFLKRVERAFAAW